MIKSFLQILPISYQEILQKKRLVMGTFLTVYHIHDGS